MCRILFGLVGPEGDAMRKADLTVYNGVPFGKISGRRRIRENLGREEYFVVASYWKDKIKEENKAIIKTNTDQHSSLGYCYHIFYTFISKAKY